MDTVDISLTSELLPKVFSQIIQAARAHFVIEEDIGSLVEKLTLFGSYSDIVAISDLLQEFVFDLKEDELHRHKSLELYVQLIEKIGIPLAYNVFTDKFINWHKRYRHSNSAALEKLVISTLSKLCIEIEPTILRTVFPYFNIFYTSIEDDPKYLNIIESKVVRAVPANNLESYFCQMCKLIHTFKSEEIPLEEQFLSNLVSKLKVDLDVNKHFINYKFRWRVHREFLWHLNTRLTNILSNHYSRNAFTVMSDSFQKILQQEDFDIDEVLPKETNQLKYFELLPNQYRLSKSQKARVLELLTKISIEDKGILLGCVQNNTVQGVVFNESQKEIFKEEILNIIDYLGSKPFRETISITFCSVRGVSVFSFENTNRFVVKIVFSPQETGQVFGFKLLESKLNNEIVRRSYACYWNPDWDVDDNKVYDAIEKNKEKAQQQQHQHQHLHLQTQQQYLQQHRSDDRIIHETSHEDRNDFYEKSTYASVTPLKQLSLTSHSSEKDSYDQESDRMNGRTEAEDRKSEVTNAWAFKIPTKKTSGQTSSVVNNFIKILF